MRKEHIVYECVSRSRVRVGHGDRGDLYQIPPISLRRAMAYCVGRLRA
jgi:hypothetical protein